MKNALAVTLLACSLTGLVTVAASFAAAQGLKPSQQYVDSVNHALAARHDLWGEEALRQPDGPSYESLRGHLHPLMNLSRLYSESEVYYLPFGMEDSVTGGADYALHYADGSEIVSRRSEVPPAEIPKDAPSYAGKRITIFVGPDGNERYGSDLARLPLPTLRSGYLPILQTAYTDADGIHYTQESFALRIPETRSLVSFVRLTAARSGSAPDATMVRIHFGFVSRTKPPKIEDETGLVVSGHRVVKGPDVYLVFSPGGVLRGPDLTYTLDLSRGAATIYLMRLNDPSPMTGRSSDAASYRASRRQLAAYWNKKLASGAQFVVPEPYAMDAEKSLLIQNLVMNRLYSIGNPYETAFSSEGHDSIRVLGLFGYLREYKAGLEAFLKKQSSIYEEAERLVHAADYYLLTRDRSFIEAHEPQFLGFITGFTSDMAANGGLLKREPGGTDISGETLHYNINHQSVAWRGWRDMLEVWRQTGHRDLEAQYAPEAAELGATIRKEALAAAHKYPDGALYIPNTVRESDDPGPFDPITATKEGAYWLLVATDGFSSGIYDRTTNEAIIKYIQDYGGTMMGLIRFNYQSTPVGGCQRDGLPGYETPGVDDAYALPYYQFLADNDRADDLVLSFYGKLAQGMTPNTFVAGEGESVGVCQDLGFANGTFDNYYRTMYLSPNSTNNAAYLLALRDMLVRESQDDRGAPEGLYLASATPRGWLADGKTIRVTNAPTYFGPLTYRIDSHLARNIVDVVLVVPSRDPIRRLQLRLRTPSHRQIRTVTLNGAPYARFDAESEMFDLTGETGSLALRVEYQP